MCIDEKDFSPDSKCAYCGTRCDICDKFDKKEKCYEKTPCSETCGFREIVFSSVNTKHDFGKWLFSPYHKDFTAITHNAKGYDNYFVLEYLIDNSIRPEIIYNGSKIMYMQVKRGFNIRCLVSLNFLSMKLADLPRAFGFISMYSTIVPDVAAEQLAALAYGSLTLGDGVMGNTLKSSPTVCLLIMLVSGNQITMMQIIDQLQLL